jgi:transposase
VREATGVGKTAVSEYVRRAKVVGLTWPIPPEISDAALERWLFTPAGFHEGSTKPLPDWTKVHEELKRNVSTTLRQPSVEFKLGFLEFSSVSRSRS